MSQAFNYIEIADGSPRNRGLLIKKEYLSKYIKQDRPVYRSMYIYNEDAVDYSDAKNSIRSYYGERDIDDIIIDVDKGDNSDEYTLKIAQSVCFQLEDQYELQRTNYGVYFSGSGYHIRIPNTVFEFQSGTDLPFKVKETLSKMFQHIDLMIYMRTGLYRLPNTLNKKTDMFKIPLSHNEFWSLKPKDIHMLAQQPRFDMDHKLEGEGELADIVINDVPRIRKLGTVAEPKKIATCIQTMYKNGPEQGKRHHTILRIVSHYRRNGVPSEAAKAALLHWNQNQLSEQEVITNVEYAYNKGYKYGCNDSLMHEYCSPKCIYYKRKDYSIGVLNADDMQKELEERLTTNFKGKAYDLSKALGLDEECMFYPGELITIFGPTGSSKTTLAHNIALGYNHVTDELEDALQIPTLYLSLELAPWYMHRRSLQIAANKTKAEVNSNYKEIYERNHEMIAHLAVQSVSPTLEQISEKIVELQPAMVVVDYIDLVDTPHQVRGEYEKIKYISHGLSSMAVNMDVIIIQISQVAREYSRSEVLDLYAGKGSGAIENASRKVIGLNGQTHKRTKSLKLFKNTDGELFDTTVEWTPSFRLRRAKNEPETNDQGSNRRTY